MIKMYTDAAVINKNRKSAGGILIIIDHQQKQIKLPLSPMDNHRAEFETCLAGFKILSKVVTNSSSSIISYYTDSKIVFDSLEKRYAKHYQEYVDQILPLEEQFSLVLHNLITDRENSGAHELSQQALHSS